MEKIRNIKGTKDLLPIDTVLWQYLENKIHHFTQSFGYQEIRTPVFENTKLFERGVGLETDIVNKEMYSWIDQGGYALTLRPELTAPVVRSYIQNDLGKSSSINRLYYIDSLFRRERPQKGRQRQFHQFGVEVFGSKFPEQDSEIIIMASSFLQSLGLKDLVLEVNTLGSDKVRYQYIKELKSLLANYRNDFSNLDQQRLEKNPLRLFDSKDPNCKEILYDKAPTIYEYITDQDREHFLNVCEILDSMNIKYIHNKKLVRGLDYYTRTTFEIKSKELGAQDAICGGGRYDELVENLGGLSTPAVGFALGVERLIILLEQTKDSLVSQKNDIFLILLGGDAITLGMKLANDIRMESNLNVITETLRRSMRSQMREANKLNAKYTIIIGDNELHNKTVMIKNMLTSEQNQISINQVVNYFVQK